MSSLSKCFDKNKRVIMLTTDELIDRRILIEADALQRNGYEVIVLARWDGVGEVFSESMGVKIERIIYGITPHHSSVAAKDDITVSKSNPTITVTDNESTSPTPVNNQYQLQNLGWIRRVAKRLPHPIKIRLWNLWRISIISIARIKIFIRDMIIDIRSAFKSLVSNGMKNQEKSTIKIDFINEKKNELPSALSALEQEYFSAALFYRPDIIHAHDYPMLKTGVFLKKTLKIPLVYDMHEFYPEQPNITGFLKTKMLSEEKRLIKFADKSITVNFLLGEIIKERYMLPEIFIVQNAVSDTGFYKRGQHYNRFCEDDPSLNGKLLLLYQGGIFKNRNLETTIEGMKYVTNKQWVLVIMGYGDHEETLKKFVKKCCVQDSVRIVPAKSQEHLLTYTASADFGLIPYPNDCDINTKYVSPNKLYEFAAVELPFISNKLPYVEWVTQRECFGKIADLSTPELFGQAIDALTLEEMEMYRENMRKNARHILWEAEEKKLIDLYSDFEYEMHKKINI